MKIRTAWIVLAMMVACGAWADSNPPAPAPTKTSQPPEQQPDSKKNHPGKLDDATVQQPSPIVATASPSIYLETADQKSGADKSSPGLWGILGVIFNGGLLVVAFLQWRIYRRQTGIMDTQHKLTVDLQRPYVHGRVTKPGLKPVNTPTGPDLIRGEVELCVDNIGATPANLTRIQWGIFTAPQGGIPPPIDSTTLGGRELPMGTVAIKGEPYFESEKLALRFIDEQKGIIEFKLTVWVIGFVRYVDIFGYHHISGFAHALDLMHERFVRRAGDRYNYAREEDPGKIPPGLVI